MTEQITPKSELEELNSIISPPHLDDIKLVDEMVKESGKTPFEIALIRMHTNPNPDLVNAALSLCDDLPPPHKALILAEAFESLAEIYERAVVKEEDPESVKKRLEAREKVGKLREFARKKLTTP